MATFSVGKGMILHWSFAVPNTPNFRAHIPNPTNGWGISLRNVASFLNAAGPAGYMLRISA